MKILQTILFFVFLAGISACAQNQVKSSDTEDSGSVAETVEQEATLQQETPTEQATAATEASEASEASEESRRTAELLDVKTYYFDYDQDELKGIAFEALDAHAEVILSRLLAQPELEVTIEGHADDRGTIEYNNALGNRRGEAVARYLRIRGVRQKNINVISYGELRPVDSADNEGAWKLNRRANLIY